MSANQSAVQGTGVGADEKVGNINAEASSEI